MGHFNIGIDTGGTYTDAVIVDAENHRIVATAKSLTTRGKLEIGVADALGKVLGMAGNQIQPEDISLVSLSTTLATNALVEGRGSNVGVILIGFSDDMVKRSQLSQAIPSAKILLVDGGHQYDGSENCELDEPTLRKLVESSKDSVEAYAIASTYSIRNTAHEIRARQIVSEYCDYPTTISSELSDGLNGPLRALTATFNVRIVALIIGLVESVGNAMRRFGIDAPLMIVKGDGSLTSAESVIAKPIETILSGPAASVIGANFLCGLDDFVIADVGGTTSDVATVRNGWPDINEKGAMAGSYRTMVRAIDMRTIGLGGDSEVELDYQGKVHLRNNRVVPISLLCHRFPEILKILEASLGEGMGLARAIRYLFRPEGSIEHGLPRGLSEADREFLEKIDHSPKPFDRLVFRASDRARADRLLDRGLVQVSGLTPSDAAHVLGLQSQWSAEGARLACLMTARSYSMISWKKDAKEVETGIQKFARAIFDAMVGKSAQLIVNQLGGTQLQVDDPLLYAVSHGEGRLQDLRIQFTPMIPVVAVGGPAPIFYPSVGERLNASAVIPENAEVANAIGAAIGLIKIRKAIEITSAEAGGYHVHHQGNPLFFPRASDAIEKAQLIASDYVLKRATAMGGESPRVEVQVDRIDLPDLDKDHSLVSALVVAECLSDPGQEPTPLPV